MTGAITEDDGVALDMLKMIVERAGVPFPEGDALGLCLFALDQAERSVLTTLLYAAYRYRARTEAEAAIDAAKRGADGKGSA